MREVLQQMTAGCSKPQQGVLTVQNQNHWDKTRVLAGPRGSRAGPPGLGPGLWLEPHLCLCAMSLSASLTQDSHTPRPLIQELLKTLLATQVTAQVSGMGPGMSRGHPAHDPPGVQPARRGGGTWLREACGGAAGVSHQPRGGGEPWKLLWGVGPGRPGSSLPFGFVSGRGVMLAADPQRPPRRAASQQIHKTPRPSGILGQWDNLQSKSPTQCLH